MIPDDVYKNSLHIFRSKLQKDGRRVWALEDRNGARAYFEENHHALHAVTFWNWPGGVLTHDLETGSLVLRAGEVGVYTGGEPWMSDPCPHCEEQLGKGPGCEG